MPEVPRMKYDEAMQLYGSDKPDTRFEMKFVEITELTKGKNFQVFESAELVVGINAKGCSEYSRKQIDELTDFVKRPQIGAKGLIYVQYRTDGTIKSSVDKFYAPDDLRRWVDKFNAQPGDLMLLLAGEAFSTRKQLNELRLFMGDKLGFRDKNKFSAFGYLIFHYSNGVKKRNVTMRCTIHLLRLSQTTSSYWIPIPVRFEPMPTIW